MHTNNNNTNLAFFALEWRFKHASLLSCNSSKQRNKKQSHCSQNTNQHVLRTQSLKPTLSSKVHTYINYGYIVKGIKASILSWLYLLLYGQASVSFQFQMKLWNIEFSKFKKVRVDKEFFNALYEQPKEKVTIKL